MWSVSQQWLDIIGETHGVQNRAEVWDRGQQIGSLPLLSGSVKDDWVSGTRRQLTLSLPPTDVVRDMLYPGVQIKPYSGIAFNSGLAEVVPMGVYPVYGRNYGIRPDATINLSCNDLWDLVVRSPFPRPRSTDTRLTVQAQIVQFLVETEQWTADQITVTVTSSVKVSAQTFDTDRSAACTSLAESIGAEVFINRLGNPVIQYRQPMVASPAATFSGRRLKDLSVAESSADVYNAVTGTSTSSDPAVPTLTYTATITDPSHPAYHRRGIPTRTYPLDSPQFKTLPQLKNATEKMLTKVSREARQLTVEGAVTDPSLDASDTIVAVWPKTGVAERQQIGSIEHSLTLQGSDSQEITTVNSRSDEDFTP